MPRTQDATALPTAGVEAQPKLLNRLPRGLATPRSCQQTEMLGGVAHTLLGDRIRTHRIPKSKTDPSFAQLRLGDRHILRFVQ